ncbi:hypothetical protein ABT282_33320 [Streptomyces sp. NPDC000927]|uniref:hypothetical protein n=1 Tax=Streptomyces sp. NPDC000927 TaxID=3154371 RepID=UPI00332650E7
MTDSRIGANVRVGVVGGSIAGCAMAIAGARAGADVTVHERSGGALQDRGFGTVVPPSLHRDLVTGGYLGTDMPTTPVADRVWITERREGGPRASRPASRPR